MPKADIADFPGSQATFIIHQLLFHFKMQIIMICNSVVMTYNIADFKVNPFWK